MTREVPALRGAFTPLVVPFRNGAVDYDLYAKIIDWQIEQGAQGLLVNATSGEPTTLTSEEKARLIDVAVKASAGRSPVAAGIPAESHAEAVTLLALAEKAGADAVVSVTPYYARPPQRGLSFSGALSPDTRAAGKLVNFVLPLRRTPSGREAHEASRGCEHSLFSARSLSVWAATPRRRSWAWRRSMALKD